MAEIDKTFREGGLKQLSDLLANPARSGIYLTRERIRRIGVEMGLRTGVQSRSRMLESLFREAGTEGRVEDLVVRLDKEAEAWLTRFRGWSKDCPPAKAAWKGWSGRTAELRRSLRKSIKWARDAAKKDQGRELQPPG